MPQVCPTYVVSVQQQQKQWSVSSTQSVDLSVDMSTYTSFRLYLDMSELGFVQVRLRVSCCGVFAVRAGDKAFGIAPCVGLIAGVSLAFSRRPSPQC